MIVLFGLKLRCVIVDYVMSANVMKKIYQHHGQKLIKLFKFMLILIYGQTKEQIRINNTIAWEYGTYKIYKMIKDSILILILIKKLLQNIMEA
jgi:hypothetical protein